MSPIRPEELSALLDGELPADRAAQVRAELERDPEQRAALQRLDVLDRSWRGAARSAQFRPVVRLPEAPPLRWPGAAAAAILLLTILRIAVRLWGSDVFVFAAQGLVLAAMLAGVARLWRQDALRAEPIPA